MQCYTHPDNVAIGTCTSCGKAMCADCAVETKNHLVCRNCLATGAALVPTGTTGTTTTKDANTAFLIEFIGGFFGLLGLGYLYVGRTSDGILRLVLWLLYDIMAFVVISLLIAVFIGILCIPVQLVIQVGVPLWSANALKKQMLSNASSSNVG